MERGARRGGGLLAAGEAREGRERPEGRPRRQPPPAAVHQLSAFLQRGGGCGSAAPGMAAARGAWPGFPFALGTARGRPAPERGGKARRLTAGAGG